MAVITIGVGKNGFTFVKRASDEKYCPTCG